MKSLAEQCFCSSCESWKDAEAFSPYRRIPNRRQSMCKTCKVEYNRKWREANPQRRAQYDREYKQRDKARHAARARRYRAAHKLEQHAREKFTRNKVNGKIKIGPCVICGEVRTEGHHEDYSKPLDVIWLCHQHHARLHWLRRYNGVQTFQDMIRGGRV